MEKPMQNPTNGFGELGMGSSVESLQRFLDSQKELFHSQVDQLQKIVLTQCRLTGVNPLAQEMAAGALSIKIGKRPRDLLNPKAIKYMQSVFCIKDTISKKETREISALCGVTVTQVREFFAGQRSRVRRFVRLAREKAIRVDSCKASLDGCSINSDHALQVSDVVPLNSVDPKDVEGSSCLSQQESNLAIDSSDKNFVENIFNLMRKEETFSGQEKLMEWVLQIQNPAVLQLFLTKGGIEILATWLNQAAVEEQTTVLLVIFKVLCHLPLHKALPAQMSAILQTVNRLRFYRTSDISNRARVLLSRWSKLFVRSQALNKPFPRNSPSDLQKERIRKQRISEILSDESWQSKIDIPEDILSLAWEGSEISRSEPTKSLKLLTASPDDSSKKHVRSVASSQTRERRKVLLVEQPGSRTPGRCMQVSRAVSTNQGRPMSADDIQKAKMRAIFMQSKYGKIGSSSNKSSPEKKEGPQASYASQTRSTLVTSKTFHPNKEEDKKPFTPSETSQALPETPIDSKPNVTSQALPETPIDSKPNVTSHEPLWQKLEKDQIPWETPSEMRINCLWRIGAGERSKEVEVQTERICREKETIHRNANDIPPDPREPWDVEMDFDDSLTPEIPREQLPEVDGKDVPSPRNCDNSTQVSVAAPPPTGNGNPEPDFELLAVLLKNPELVFALTSGQGNSLTSAETVALLDKLRAIGIRLPSVLGGLDGNVAEKREVTSLPSPTPPHEQAMRWKSEPAQMLVPNKATPSLPVFPQFSNGEDVTFQGVSLTPSVTAEKPMPSGSSLHQFLITSSPVAHAPSLQQRPLISPLPDRPPNHSTSVAVSPSLQQLPLVSPLPSKPLPVNQTGPHLQSTPTSSLPPVHTPVAPPVLRQPSRTIPAPPHQIPVTISSSEQRPVPETMLAANRFQVTRSHNQNNLSTGSDIRQLPTIRVENSSFGRIPNLKNPSMTAFTNTTMDRPHTPSLMPSLIPNPTPMRSQPARLPEHQAFSAPPATWSLNVHPSGRYGSASNSNASSNSRPKGSLDDRSFDIRLPDNRNNCDAFRTGPMQPQFLHGPAVERNEFLAEPELEEWSPDRSPLRTSEFRSDRSPLRTSEFRPDRSPLRTSELRPDRKYNEPRKDYGRSYRPEWPRHRNSGHRERDRDHRSGNRRWRDRRY